MPLDFVADLPTVELTVPAWQMILFIFLLSIFTLFRSHRLCLITTYLFTFYWGFFLYWTEFVSSMGRYPIAETVYVLFGGLLLILAVIAYFREE